MTKERRLGRGLEALLGRVAAKADPQTPAECARPADPAPAPAEATYGNATEELYGGPSPYRESPAAQAPSAVPFSPAQAADVEKPSSPAAPATPSGLPRVPIRQIESNPFQPRQDFDEDEIQSLADSLRAHGLLQAVVVRKLAEGRYQLIAGERRLRAAAKAGWADVPVQVVEADDRQLAELAIVENLQRKDLNPLEKAASFQRYLEEYGCTQEELASRLKLDRSTIANFIRLLELPATVQEAVRQGKITQGHARALLPLGEEREQVEFSQRIQKEGLSVRQTEAMVQEAIAEADAEPLGVIGANGSQKLARRTGSEHVAALEQEFRSALGTKVTITHSTRGRGKVTIPFASHEEFERLRRMICQGGQPDLKSQVG